jgi:hypothetical protein
MMRLRSSKGQGKDGRFLNKLMNSNISIMMYTIFTQGGFDLMGGYAYYKLLLKLVGKEDTSDKEMTDTKTDIVPDFEMQREGMEIMQKLFSGDLGIKLPFFWKDVIM